MSIDKEQARQLAALYQQGQLPRALALAQQWQADHADDLFLSNFIGLACSALGRTEEAIAACRRSVALSPHSAELHLTLGNTLDRAGRPLDALESVRRALELQPGYAEAHNNVGNLLNRLGRPEEAAPCFQQALALKPGLVPARINLGNALLRLGRADEAVAHLRQGLAGGQGDADDYGNLGLACQAVGAQTEAVAAFRRATELKPGSAGAWNNLGLALQDIGRAGDAEAAFRRALAMDPAYVGALNNLAIAQRELGRHAEATASLLAACRLDPGHTAIRAQLLQHLAHVCDWQSLGPHLAAEAAKLAVGPERRTAPPPFLLVALVRDPDQQRRLAEHWVRVACPPIEPVPAFPAPADDVIRIGYFSADFHSHATMYLMARLLEVHDRRRFRIHAFSYGPDPEGDAMRRRVRQAVDAFHDVRALSDREVAALARREGIDIAVDLKGLTGLARPAIFAHRAAPVQVNWLGYPGTMGAPWIDYLIGDRVVIPDVARRHYSEQVVWLPGSYQANDETRPIAAATADRAACGLPPNGIVFCCFNKAFKIDARVFDIWMRLLQRVEGSVLWLFRDNDLAVANLRQEAECRGVAAERLVFAEHAAQADHLARHRLADLFLDTLVCNAHTTASDALWAGLPVVTRLGETFAGRVSASLLTALGMPELIADSDEAYEDLALRLATDDAWRRTMRERLQAQLTRAPLFDSQRFARGIEAAFERMHQRRCDGLAPAAIDIASEDTGGRPV
jgi:predicted O-linked N-acetylglucosamine transferase (SPINDLY family)